MEATLNERLWKAHAVALEQIILEQGVKIDLQDSAILGMERHFDAHLGQLAQRFSEELGQLRRTVEILHAQAHERLNPSEAIPWDTHRDRPEHIRHGKMFDSLSLKQIESEVKKIRGRNFNFRVDEPDVTKDNYFRKHDTT